MVIDTANESPTAQLSCAVSTTVWLLSSVTHVMVKVVLKTEAAENRSCHSTGIEELVVQLLQFDLLKPPR